MIKIGTRTSPLALAQTHIVIKELEKIYKDPIEIVSMETQGDRILNQSLSEFGGKGLFTKELEEALLEGRIDCAVHSLKDMSTLISKDLEIAAVLEREDPRDAFLSPHYQSLEDLPHGAVVGTASLRRQAFIAHYYPHLKSQLIRGNVGTRIEKMKEGPFDGIILALAGLKRLKIEDQIKQILEIHHFIPAPAQGILAVECLKNNKKIKELLSSINHGPTLFASQMERLFLSTLEGSCKTPLAAFLKPGEQAYDFWYMSVSKEETFTYGALKGIKPQDLPLRIQKLALELKKAGQGK